jgi:periplasmic copper chaperone A
MNRITAVVALATTAALAGPVAASAHVSVNPREAAAGSFSVMTVRVPNERDDKGTRKVNLTLPDGVYFLSYKKVPGWKIKVTKRQLETPVDLGGFSVDEQFTKVTFTARKRGIIRPGQFEEFPLSVRVPSGNAGDVIAFGAVQVYQGGEKVRWTGAPDSETPAPRVTLTAPVAE